MSSCSHESKMAKHFIATSGTNETSEVHCSFISSDQVFCIVLDDMPISHECSSNVNAGSSIYEMFQLHTFPLYEEMLRQNTSHH